MHSLDNRGVKVGACLGIECPQVVEILLVDVLVRPVQPLVLGEVARLAESDGLVLVEDDAGRGVADGVGGLVR